MRRAATLLLLALALGSAEAEGLRLEPSGPDGLRLRPFALNRAVLRREGGFRGSARIEGLDWEGRSRTLFAARPEAWTERLEAVFYLDEEIRSLRLVAEEAGGTELGDIDLAAEEARSAPADPAAEAARRAAARALPPPYRVAQRGRLSGRNPASLALAGESAASAALVAAGPAFALPGPGAGLLVLAAFALLASLAAALPSRPGAAGRKAWRVAPLLLLSLLAALAVALALPRKALLYRLALPAEDPAASIDGVLEAGLRGGEAWSGVDFGDPEGAGLVLVGIHAPAGSLLPLSALGVEDRGLRLARPLTVRLEGGRAFVETETFTMGWVLGGGADETR